MIGSENELASGRNSKVPMASICRNSVWVIHVQLAESLFEIGAALGGVGVVGLIAVVAVNW